MFRSKVSYAKVTQPAVCESDLKLLKCQDLLMFRRFSRLIRFVVIITIKSLWFPRAQQQDDRCSIKMSREMNPPPASALSGRVKPRHCLCDLHITADGLHCLHWKQPSADWGFTGSLSHRQQVNHCACDQSLLELCLMVTPSIKH